MDDKLAKFEELAEKRVTETIKKLKLIGNLSNKRNYSYTDEHVKQILDALEHEFRLLKNRFREESSVDSYEFSFRKKEN